MGVSAIAEPLVQLCLHYIPCMIILPSEVLCIIGREREKERDQYNASLVMTTDVRLVF